MTGITKIEASILWGNGFKLRYDENPGGYSDYKITNLTEDEYGTVLLKLDGEIEISASQIGTDYFIICHSLDKLTQPIMHEGKEIVPIMELYKLSNEYYKNDELDYEYIDSWGAGKILKVWHNKVKEEYTEFIFTTISGFRKDRRHQKGSFVFGMDLPHPIRCKSKIYNQPALFAYMDSLHFDRFGWSERGLTTPK